MQNAQFPACATWLCQVLGGGKLCRNKQHTFSTYYISKLLSKPSPRSRQAKQAPNGKPPQHLTTSCILAREPYPYTKNVVDARLPLVYGSFCQFPRPKKKRPQPQVTLCRWRWTGSPGESAAPARSPGSTAKACSGVAGGSPGALKDKEKES